MLFAASQSCHSLVQGAVVLEIIIVHIAGLCQANSKAVFLPSCLYVTVVPFVQLALFFVQFCPILDERANDWTKRVPSRLNMKGLFFILVGNLVAYLGRLTD